MKWTNEIPQQEGWYWISYGDFGYASIEYFHYSHDLGELAGCDRDYEEFPLSGLSSVSFAGPIPEPEM